MKNIYFPGFKIANFIAIILLAMFSILIFYRCEKETENKTFITAEGFTIVEYLKIHSDTFGEFYKVLETTKSVSFLSAYGNYTCFVPTNDALITFYQSKGKTSIDDFYTTDDTVLLKQLVAYHVCPNGMSTDLFTNGGLPDTTMSGDYLVTTFEEGGINNIKVNNEATIIIRDIYTINGVIHGIDKVLDPVVYTVAEMLENDGRYNIFTKALKETGLYDSLNIKSFQVTVFAETDSVFNLKEINDYSDLFRKYSQTGEPYQNPEDSLYLWIAYHCIGHTLFLSDFDNLTYSNLTYSMLFTVNKGSEFLINQATPVNIELSNNSAKNGVFHSLSALIEFVPVPVAIYWDIVDKPELRALTDYFRKQTISVIPGPELPDGVAGINIEPGDFWKYGYQNKWYNQNDYFEYQFDAANNRLWFEFITPPLVKGGIYKIWICGKCVNGNRGTGDVYWDSECVFRMEMGVEFTGIDEDWEIHGKKHYTTPDSPQSVGFYIGTFEITTEGSHKVKVVGVKDGYYTLDMIQFIPADENQLAVKFTRP